MPGTVYFHIGAGKTGSSAIQVALVRNRTLLLEHGLVYPASKSDSRALKGLTTTGNGESLAGLLWSADRDCKAQESRNGRRAPLKDRIWAPNALAAQSAQAKLGRLLEDNGGCSFVYSSEMLEALSPKTLTALCNLFRQNGLQVKVIYYVRHLMDHAFSSYNQLVKGEMRSGSFADFVRRHPSRFAQVIETYSSVIGARNIILRLYENERSNLAARFFELLLKQEGIERGEPFVPQGDRDPVNRSLAPQELDVMLWVNNLLAKTCRKDAWQISKAISNRITRLLRPSDTRKVVSAREMRLLRDGNRQVIKFVNDLAAGDFQLKFKSDDMMIGTRSAAGEDDEASLVYRTVIESLIDQIGEAATAKAARPKGPSQGQQTWSRMRRATLR